MGLLRRPEVGLGNSLQPGRGGRLLAGSAQLQVRVRRQQQQRRQQQHQ